jgi:hypothetical protein
MSITKQTAARLEQIAINLYQKWGTEVINFSDLINQAVKEGKLLGYDIIHRTVSRNEKFLINEIRRIDKNAKLREKRKEEKEIIHTIKEEKKITKIIVYYNDGSFEEVLRADNLKVDTLPESVVKSVPGAVFNVPEVKWKGIFDYKSDGSIVIQKQKGRNAKFNGCDITNGASFKKHFVYLSVAIEWCEWALIAPKIYKSMFNPDLEKNAETLAEFKNKLINIKNKKV